MADVNPINPEMPEYLKNFPINPNQDVKQDYAEFQEIHNALHTLAYYLKFVRTGIVSDDNKKPSESVPFTRFVRGIAAEKIEEGKVVGPEIGGWRNGFTRSAGLMVPDPTAVTPGQQLVAGKSMNFAAISLEAAEIGEEFLAGIGFAIIEVTGVKCGQAVYAQSSSTVRYQGIPGEQGNQILGSDWSGDGGLYITRPAPADAPGYPITPGGGNPVIFSRAGTAVIGVGVADNFMMLGQELIHDRSNLGDPNRPGNPNIPLT